MHNNIDFFMALDVGDKRIGVALANSIAKIASPLTVIANNQQAFTKINEIIREHLVTELIVGLPRNMSGEETEQTKKVRDFVNNLKKHIDIPLSFQDESLTTVEAEKRLLASNAGYNKESIDAVAASIILEDFLKTTMD